MEHLLNQILEEIQIMKNTMATKEEIRGIQSDLHVIKESLQRQELNQPEDIKAMLVTISNKLDDRDADVHVLNKRVFKVESALERLSNL